MDKGASENGDRKLIAVVESDPAVRNSLAFSLETEGFRTCTFTRGYDFLNIVATSPIACLIVEYRLADNSGIDLIDDLKDLGCTFPVILLATQPSPDVVQQATQRRVPIIEKPLLGNVLTDKLRSLLK
jgi:two-component system response regulator FixJ